MRGAGRDRPFSKGVLSQSLLAAAIDPADAFEVAREIERELARKQLSEIDRRDLRQITYDMVKRRSGPGAAERYLVCATTRSRAVR